MTSFLRPDERAAQAEIERANSRNQTIKKGAKGIATAVGIGASLTGVGAATKILPFLNEYVPADLALKGISKLSPKVGQFLKNGMESGLDLKSGLDYLKENLGNKKAEKDPMKLISGYSPELSQFIQGHIQNGRTPTEAAALAKMPGKHEKAVKAIENDMKENFVDMIARLFGGQAPQAQPQQGQQAAQQTQQPQEQQAQPQQGGQGQQALMAMLQKINQRMGQ